MNVQVDLSINRTRQEFYFPLAKAIVIDKITEALKSELETNPNLSLTNLGANAREALKTKVFDKASKLLEGAYCASFSKYDGLIYGSSSMAGLLRISFRFKDNTLTIGTEDRLVLSPPDFLRTSGIPVYQCDLVKPYDSDNDGLLTISDLEKMPVDKLNSYIGILQTIGTAPPKDYPDRKTHIDKSVHTIQYILEHLSKQKLKEFFATNPSYEYCDWERNEKGESIKKILYKTTYDDLMARN